MLRNANVMMILYWDRGIGGAKCRGKQVLEGTTELSKKYSEKYDSKATILL